MMTSPAASLGMQGSVAYAGVGWAGQSGAPESPPVGCGPSAEKAASSAAGSAGPSVGTSHPSSDTAALCSGRSQPSASAEASLSAEPGQTSHCTFPW